MKIVTCNYKFASHDLSGRSLAGHKLSGSVSPDLGKLDQLKILYVSLRNIIAFLVVDVSLIYQNVFLWLILWMMYYVVELFITTTFMGLFLQIWGIAQSCRECKFTCTNCYLVKSVLMFTTEWWLFIFPISWLEIIIYSDSTKNICLITDMCSSF